MEKAQQDLQSARVQIDDLQTRLEQGQSSASLIQSQLQAQFNGVQSLQSQLKRIQSYHGYDDTHPRAYIYSITWGGQSFIDNIGLREKLYGFLDNKQPFTVSNEFVGNDPAPMLIKWLHVVYSFKDPHGNERIRILVGKEMTEVRFDAYTAA